MSHLRSFEGQELVVIVANGRRAFTAETVGKALEYNEPAKRIADLHRRNEKEFERGLDWDWWDTEAERTELSRRGRYTTRIYYWPGVAIISVLSNQPKAATFRRWADQVLSIGQEYSAGVQWAGERDPWITEPGPSRHNRSHRMPSAVPQSIMDNPELGMAIMFTKLVEELQRRDLASLRDQDLIKYTHAAGSALLTHRSSKLKPSQPDD